jgi:hypothetical protein
MKSPLDSLLALGVIPPVTFAPDSRYYGSTTLTCTLPDGQSVSYLARRFVPQPTAANFSSVATHAVVRGDRLDLVAARYLGDPLLFWLLCDANGAIRPDELISTPGRILQITTPQGVPGAPHA